MEDTCNQDTNEEREQGDGEENNTQEKNLDDDEDRRNPQYIPKKGIFYEHDDRTSSEIKSEFIVKKEEKKKTVGTVWKERDRWLHDKFIEREQTPKSQDELVFIYGYDIRNEDVPPRSLRRRKYGRGPNKYSRNWQDEEAYEKANVKQKDVYKSRIEKSENYFRKKSLTPSNKVSFKKNFNHSKFEKNKSYSNTSAPKINNPVKFSEMKSSELQGHRRTKSTPNCIEQQTQTELNLLKFQNSNFEKATVISEQMKDSIKFNKDLRKISVSTSSVKKNSSERRQTSIPPRLQDSVNRPKRYSSLRQRSVVEGGAARFSEPTFYDCGQPSGPGRNGTSHINIPINGNLSVPSNYNENYSSCSISSVSSSQSSHLFPPAVNSSSQAINTASFIAGNGPILSYAPNPIEYSPYGFQAYSAALQVSQPQEIYSNGIAYYGPQHQIISHMSARRPTAAIPIMPPPQEQELMLQNKIFYENDENLINSELYNSKTVDVQNVYMDKTAVKDFHVDDVAAALYEIVTVTESNHEGYEPYKELVFKGNMVDLSQTKNCQEIAQNIELSVSYQGVNSESINQNDFTKSEIFSIEEESERHQNETLEYSSGIINDQEINLNTDSENAFKNLTLQDNELLTPCSGKEIPILLDSNEKIKYSEEKIESQNKVDITQIDFVSAETNIENNSEIQSEDELKNKSDENINCVNENCNEILT